MLQSLGNLALDADTMCFFIDESGDSLLQGKQSAFCLGGCAVHSTQLPFIENQWKLLMVRLFGKSDHIFHATGSETGSLSDLQKQKIYDFCKRNYFGRFGVGYHKNSEIEDYPSEPYKICADLLVHDGIIKILQNYLIIKTLPTGVKHPSRDIYLSAQRLPFRRIVIIFEDCERDRELIKRSYGDIKNYNLNGIEIEPEFCFMPKNFSHPCLQIADLIANSCYREVLRHYRSKKSDQAYDFKEIFHSGEDRVKYFVAIDKLSINNGIDSHQNQTN